MTSPKGHHHVNVNNIYIPAPFVKGEFNKCAGTCGPRDKSLAGRPFRCGACNASTHSNAKALEINKYRRL
jgi:hypothetical protein